MTKAATVFEKYAAKKKRYMSKEIKGLIAGGPAALVATTMTFPLDSVTTARQMNALKGLDISFSNFYHNPRDLVKLYKGLPAKLTKTVPAMAISFATYEAGKKLLDKKFTSKK